MNDLVWILESGKDTSFGKRGVSSSYIIPKGDMNISPVSVAGRRLWVIFRGNDDRMLLSAQISKIEEITEGYHKDDFLVSTNLLSSFRVDSRHSSASHYITVVAKALDLGIHEINADQRALLENITLKSIKIKLAKPNKSLFANINKEILPNSGNMLAQVALESIISNFNLCDIWEDGANEKLGAFPNFALAFISEDIDVDGRYEINDLLKKFDPLGNSLQNTADSESQKNVHGKVNLPSVNIKFRDIDPSKIYARKFVASDNAFDSMENAMSKTERAEKRHQEIIKDIAEFLLSQGILPYESNSVDILYRLDNAFMLCEIKSARIENIFNQASKGAFQLACYLDSLSDVYDNITPYLIIEKTHNRKVEAYLAKILSGMNINVLFYDSEQNWPYKIQGLVF